MRQIKITYNFLTVLSVLVFALPFCVQAQNTGKYDYSSIEASINGHKRLRVELLTRSSLELGLEALHKDTKKAAESFEAVSDSLDKYSKCFDIIEVLYSGASTAYDVYRTYDAVKNRIEDITELLKRYKDKCLLSNRLTMQDTIIWKVAENTSKLLGAEIKSLMDSTLKLAGYATGKNNCSIHQLLEMLDKIDNNLYNVRIYVDNAYGLLWRYINLRTATWCFKPIKLHSRKTIVKDAFTRWKKNADDAFEKTSKKDNKYDETTKTRE